MAAGDYTTRLQRLVYSPIPNTSYGGENINHVPGSFYWCNLERQSGRNSQQYGATLTGAEVVVRVRNYPALTAQDRLTDGETVIILDTVRRGDNELIAEGYFLDVTQTWAN